MIRDSRIHDLRTRPRGGVLRPVRQPGTRPAVPPAALTRGMRRPVTVSGPATVWRSRFGGQNIRRFPVVPGTPFVPTDNLSGLGFSLKPPKWARKAATSIKKAVTLKRVLVGAAVIGGAALIPGALPLLAKGVVGAGKVALGTGKIALRGVSTVAKFAGKNIGTAAGIFMPQGGGVAIAEQASLPSPELPIPEPTVPMPTGYDITSAGVPSPVSYGGPSPVSYGAQPYTVETAAPASGPQAAGFGGALVPLAIGGVILFALASRSRVRRA